MNLELAIGRFHHGLLAPAELTAVFLRSAVFCQRRDRRQVVATGPPGKGFVLAFSSVGELARYQAKFPDRGADGVDWLSTTGEDLVSLLPDGYGIALDVAGDHPVALPATALNRVLVLKARPPETADAVSG